MPKKRKENHLDVYNDRFELHQGDQTKVYRQGVQNNKTKRRYNRINAAFESGYLDKIMENLKEVDFSSLDNNNRTLLRNLVDGITSDYGRALVSLSHLQLAIKSIAPDQCVRLHKGGTRRGQFSWVDGISMRTLDSKYNVPFLRKHSLLNLNKYGTLMTRSYAENYPYSKLYKAEIKGPVNAWLEIVDALEDNTIPPEPALCYLMSLLKNRSDSFQKIANEACKLVKQYDGTEFTQIQKLLVHFFDTTDYSARAFEVVLHALLQAMEECHLLGDSALVPLSQMRSANKKHGNVGDIELIEEDSIVEAWDAKYGKPYLRDELEELRDKLLTHPEIKIAGFVVDSSVDKRKDILNRIDELTLETGTEILLFSFAEWVQYKIGTLPKTEKNAVGYRWITAVTESFAQKRKEIAPIDEPCEAWLNDLIQIFSKKQ